MNKKITWIIVFLAFAVLVKAACPPDCSTSTSITTQSYNTEAAYTNQDFLTNSDPAKWNWAYIDASNFAKIWANPKIQDAFNENDAAREKYLQMQGCAGCSLKKETGYTGKLTFSKEGIMHENQDFCSIKNYPGSSTFTANEHGITITLPEKTSSLNIPSKSDTVTIDTAKNNVTLSGENIPAGTNINGQMRFSNGQAYVKLGAENAVRINGAGVSFESTLGETAAGNEMKVFFNGLPHTEITEDYVSINPSTGKIFTHSDDKAGGPRIWFEKNNPFIKMDDNDIATIGTDYNTDISIENRDKDQLIPLIQVKETSNDKVSYDISSGAYTFYKSYSSANEPGYFTDNELYSYISAGEEAESDTTAPMRISLKDAAGNPVLANMNGNKNDIEDIFVDNYNRVFSGTITKGPMTPYEQYIGPDFSITMQYLSFNYNAYYPGKDFLFYQSGFDETQMKELIQSHPDKLIIAGADQDEVRQIISYINLLPPDIKNNLKGFNVLYGDDYPGSKTSNAYATEYGFMTLKGENLKAGKTDFYTIFHEGQHEVDFTYEAQEGAEVSAQGILGECTQGVKCTGFRTKWEALGAQYNGKTASKSSSGYYEWNIIDPKTKKPYEYDIPIPGTGCISAYACKDFYENVAVTAEEAQRNPEYFRDNFLSDAIVRGQIELLCEYNRLSCNKCNIIIGKQC